MAKTVVAMCYDFDKTLATNDMQTFSFIPRLGMTEGEFWGECSKFTHENVSDSTLTYLHIMMDECRKKGIDLTREYLRQCGKDVKFYDGVTTWFKRINEYAQSKGLEVEHYIISSGNREIIEGSSIYKEFKNVYGCEFLYDEKGIAYWPKTIVNYTLKTQYLFRICKGATELTDDETINQRVDKKHVEFRNIIYIGDGITDVPAMTLVKEKNGTAIAVYQKSSKEKSDKLWMDGRVNFAFRNDFRQNSKLENAVKLVLDSIALREQIIDLETVPKSVEANIKR